MKVLSVGNSFSADTMEHLGNIAKSLGVEKFKFSNLYIGGCSINRHYNNAVNNIAGYIYHENTGEGWSKKENFAIDDVVKSEKWDYISIQHGTGDKSRYTSPESYVNLPLLVKHIKNLAHKDTKIVFNMAWVADPDSVHHEITSYGGNQLLMYQNLVTITRDIVSKTDGIDMVSPAGTAIQNARNYIDKKLTRDGFHLSYDLGRYIAGLSFLKTLYNIDLSSVSWCPDGVDGDEMEKAKKAVYSAYETPFPLSADVK